jgi:hypothetical protein
MTHARAGAPDHVYDAKVSDRIDGKRPRWPRPARSRTSSATSWPTSARTYSAGRDLSGRSSSVAHAMPGTGATSPDGQHQLPPAGLLR